MENGEEIFYTEEKSPVGPLLIVGDEAVLRQVWFAKGRSEKRPESSWKLNRKMFVRVVEQLRAYFAGELQEFDLKLEMRGTAFQRSCWEALRRIPYGQTISYLQLAEKIGNPKAVRAVGLANGANPIPIIVPCHRVIGSDGSLTGFGGGMENKRKLLELESAQLRLL